MDKKFTERCGGRCGERSRTSESNCVVEVNHISFIITQLPAPSSRLLDPNPMAISNKFAKLFKHACLL